MRVKCVGKNRNDKGVIVNYNLVDETGREFQATAQQIKVEIRKGQYQFTNLQIDKAGRLIDKADNAESKNIEHIKMGNGIEKYVIKTNSDSSATSEDYINFLEKVRANRDFDTKSGTIITRAFLSNNDDVGLDLLVNISNDEDFNVRSKEYAANLFYYDYHGYYEEGRYFRYRNCYIFNNENWISLLSKEAMFMFVKLHEESIKKLGITVEIYYKNEKGFIKLYR